MYRNVIVGVDGKQGGRDAAALLAVLTGPAAVRCLVHVNTTGDDAVDAQAGDEDTLAMLLADELELSGGDAQLERVTAFSVGVGLNQVAEQRGADLVVVGASRPHGLTRMFAKHDVMSVMHQTPCAVAVAPAGFAENPKILARIGVAYDGSPESGVALAHAGLLAATRRSELIPQHAVEPHFYPPGWGMTAVPVDDPAAELALAHERLGRADGVEVQHVYGPATECLLEFSRNVDLLVCGSRHNGPGRRIVLGRGHGAGKRSRADGADRMSRTSSTE
jgi:nucleotide-binding universal stress UspA family protein